LAIRKENAAKVRPKTFCRLVHNIKQHIIFRIFTLLVLASLFTPSVLKFAHIFEHHNHVVCNGDTDTHIHQVDLECEFFKFKLNNYFLSPLIKDTWLQTPYFKQAYFLTYKFLNTHKPLSFSLRGPPVLV